MASDSIDLVEEIYAAALDPARYDQLMARWEAYAEACLRPALLRPDGLLRDGLLERHVRLALQVFDRIGRDQRTRRSAEALLTGLPVAALIVDARLRILAANAAAQALLAGSARPCLDDLALDELSGRRLRAWLTDDRRRSEPMLLLPCGLGPAADPSCIVAARVDLAHPLALSGLTLEVEAGEHFLLTTLDLRFDAAVALALARAFRLSGAEAEVALALARGGSPKAIAAERAVSLHTVRSQIKSLLAKLSAAAIPDLVRMVSGLAAAVAINRGLDRAGAVGSTTCRQRRKATLRLRDGRILAFEESGAAAGRPVLVVHNMLQGPALSDAAIAAAGRRSWRLIGPSRPGFGGSDPLLQAAPAEVMDAFAGDVAELLDHLAVEQALLVGHLAGGVQALRLAELMPERFTGLLLVGYVPLRRDEMLLALPPPQRAFGLTIRYAPQLLPFIARAGAAYIDAGGEERLLRRLHATIPADLAALRRPEVLARAIEGLRHAVQQGPAAFCHDCQLVLSDWTWRAAALDLPAELILGAGDQFTLPDHGRAFVEQLPRFGLSVIEGAGMYLLYSHWPAVFQRLEALWRDPGRPALRASA